MMFPVLALSLALATAHQVLAVDTTDGMTVSTPSSLVQCQAAAISWTGGTAPYNPSVIPGGNSGAAALVTFPATQGNSVVWNVNLASGTSVTLEIRDAQGGLAYSSPITIQSSSDSSCVGQSASVSSGSAATTSAAAASTAKTSTTTEKTTSTSSGTAMAMSTSTMAMTTSTTTSSSSSSNAAAGSVAGYGAAAVAGLVGAAVAALAL